MHDPGSAFERPPNGQEGRQALEREARLPLTGWQQEVDQGLRFGLEAAESIVDRRISTFSRGELPHFAGINTFLKAPYVEDVREVGKYDAAVMGVPFDGGKAEGFQFLVGEGQMLEAFEKAVRGMKTGEIGRAHV